jgi:hypothetical protein
VFMTCLGLAKDKYVTVFLLFLLTQIGLLGMFGLRTVIK